MSTALKLAFIWTALCTQLVSSQSRHNQYASILQDTRNEPTPDGYFGYLYKTEDGIVSSARGDPSGVIHGTFSYTDPTGLKVNYNYNAGSRFTPGLGYHKGNVAKISSDPSPASKSYNKPAPVSSRYREPEPDYADDPQYYSEPSDEYVEPVPQYRSRARQVSRDPADVYQESRRNRHAPRGNALFDDSNYRG